MIGALNRLSVMKSFDFFLSMFYESGDYGGEKENDDKLHLNSLLRLLFLVCFFVLTTLLIIIIIGDTFPV